MTRAVLAAFLLAGCATTHVATPDAQSAAPQHEVDQTPVESQAVDYGAAGMRQMQEMLDRERESHDGCSMGKDGAR